MSFITYIIPMIIAGIVNRVICRITKSNSNKLFVIFIIAIAAFFIVGDLYGDGSTFGLGFAAAIAYNIFKVRTDPETTETFESESQKQTA